MSCETLPGATYRQLRAWKCSLPELGVKLTRQVLFDRIFCDSISGII